MCTAHGVVACFIPPVCPDVVVRMGMSKEWYNLQSVLKEAGDLAPVAVDWLPVFST